MRMVPVQATSSSVEVHRQEKVRIAQCVDSVRHFFCLIINTIPFATDNPFQEFNLSTVFTPFTALIFLVSMFNAVVSRTITVKVPWKMPSTESMLSERSEMPVSLPITEVMLVTIEMSSRPVTRKVTIYPLSPLPLHLAWMMR